MMSIIFRLLFILLHYLYSLIDSIHKMYMYLKLVLHHEKPIQHEENYLKLRIANLNKIPSHIVLILGNEKPSFVDLARLILWCVASGITIISLYDYQGVLKKSEEKLLNAVIDKRKENVEKLLWNKSYQNGTNGSNNGYKNGSHSQKKFHVNIVSFVDGQQYVVDVTKQLIETDVKTGIDIELLKKYLHNKFKFPEPDLALIFGNLYCTYGVLPWYIHTTEFFKLDTHHCINVETFYNTLRKYSRSEQRYGK